MNYYLYEAMDRLAVQLRQLDECLADEHKVVMPELALKKLELAVTELYAAYNETAGKWHDEAEKCAEPRA
jgi:hypothetical protein